MKDKVILHADLNNFYASVAQLYNPDLKDKYFVVSGNPDKRHGVVLAKNEAAKKAGIKTGETLNEAKRKVKNLFALPPDFKKYSNLSKQVSAIYKEYTPYVESFGLDECWLDVTDTLNMFGGGYEIAEEIRNRIKTEIGLTVSIGVSFSKIFAKLGSDMKKPDAVTVISRENFRDKVWGLPVGELLYVGKSMKTRLEEMGLRTIGDVANSDRSALNAVFGKNGDKLYLMANGEDGEPVASADEKHLPESVSNGSTTERDIDNLSDAKSLIYSLSEVIAFRLRKYRLSALGVYIGIRDNQLKYISRQSKVLYPTSDAKEIADFAIELLLRHYDFQVDKPLRMITVGTYNLIGEKESVQSSFFQSDEDKKEKINDRLDALRKKYGYGILKRAIEINPDFSCDAREAEDGYVPFDRNPNKN